MFDNYQSEPSQKYLETLRLPSAWDIAPETWPSPWRWREISRKNALHLFPKSAYHSLRLDKSLFSQKLAIISDPKAISQICGANSRQYRLTNLHLRMLTPALGSGIIVAEGEPWKSQRRIAARRAHPKSFLANRSLIEPEIVSLLDKWSGFPLDHPQVLLDDLCATSIDLITLLFFGHRPSIPHGQIIDLIRRHRQIVEAVDWLDIFGISPMVGSRKMKDARAISHELDQQIFQEISWWQAKSTDPQLEKYDFDARDFSLSILSGFESVAVTTNWSLAILALCPELQELVRTEIGQGANHLENDTLRCVLLETLRLFPPLPLIYRTALKDHASCAGTIKQGTIVCMSPFLVHRNSLLWEKPDVFDANRWTGVSPDDVDAFLPFGVGARQCIGKHIGMLLCEEILRAVIKRFDVRLNGKADDLVPRAGVSLRPLKKLSFSLIER